MKNFSKCANYVVCSNFNRFKSKFCLDCEYYFNRKLIIKKFKTTDDDYNCPICLSSKDDTIFIKQLKCQHSVCIDCIKNIYFNPDQYKNIPINPCAKIKKSWDLFITSNHSICLKSMLLDTLYHFHYDESLITEFIKYNSHTIPSLFIKDFRKLIKFETDRFKFIKNIKNRQYDKIKHFVKCPYCRNNTSDNVYIQIQEPNTNENDSIIDLEETNIDQRNNETFNINLSIII